MQKPIIFHRFHVVLTLLVGAAISVAACKSGPAPAGKTAKAPADTTASTDPDVARAQAVLRPLKKRLMGEVMAAMKAGGPIKAIEVCQIKAPQITREVAPAGMTIGRTSHKVRNPQNAPKEWHKPILALYQGKARGQAPAFQKTKLPDGSIGYAEPIYTGAPCLKCHGDDKSIPPAVSALLAKTYPKDQAKGFAAGQFRGIFWVEMAPAK